MNIFKRQACLRVVYLSENTSKLSQVLKNVLQWKLISEK